MTFLPHNDGIDHINIYSQGKTELGRLLSNFAHIPFSCEDGVFASIEGYWYWLSVPEDNIRRYLLKSVAGWEAKTLGRALRGKDWDNNPTFKRKICAAIEAKISQNKGLKNLFIQSVLPFDHYYVYNGKKKSVVGAGWIIDYITNYRDILQRGSGEGSEHV